MQALLHLLLAGECAAVRLDAHLPRLHCRIIGPWSRDLPTLRALAPVLELLRRPVVDTLYLSPLAFPENPYHRLVKDYKLVRGAVSDPVADARLAAKVFCEQWGELARRAETAEADLLRLYRFCFRGATGLAGADRGGDGLAGAFASLGADPPSPGATLELALARWRGMTCAKAAPALALRHLAEPRLRPVAAYATAWLQVSGARSVLPPWVRRRFPETADLLRQLRDVPCGDPECPWCTEVHNPRAELKRWFGFGAFRALPATPEGDSLQEAVVTHGMGGGCQLAILRTGGGKSLCFQLPSGGRCPDAGQPGDGAQLRDPLGAAPGPLPRRRRLALDAARREGHGAPPRPDRRRWLASRGSRRG